MRAEEKQLEGPELEQNVEREQLIESEEREHEELPQLASEEVRDIELEHRSRLFDALKLIMAREQLTVSLLGLPQRETLALEALQTAVTGRSVHMNQFVFAEDRKSLLEQSLAVLQQNLAYGDSAELAELHGRYDELVARIGDLRHELTQLEDAQDDLFDEKRQYLEEQATGDETEDETAKPDEADLDADASLTDLVGAALLAAAESGPHRAPAAEDRESSLYGPERPLEPKPPSSLVDEPAPSQPTKPPLKRRGKRG